MDIDSQLPADRADSGIATPVIVSGPPDVGTAVRVMKEGAADYIWSKISLDDMLTVIRAALEPQGHRVIYLVSGA